MLVANLPEGLDALHLAKLCTGTAKGAVHLHVARDDMRMESLRAVLGFVAPDLEIVCFPAWDCLPYDRVSPRRDILAVRTALLGRLARGGEEKPLLVITTVNALLQRVGPKALYKDGAMTLKPGGNADPKKVIELLDHCGYQRVESVGEPGEYAPRGGILDYFPPEAPTPLRLDFFGDELESIRTFDAITQKSIGSVDNAVIGPVSEVLLDDQSVERFRTGYRETFGVIRNDPLYEAVSTRRQHQGVEHWLPLFYENLPSLFSYLPKGTGVSLDHQMEDSAAARFESIEDFYEARKSYEGIAESDGWVYRPLAPIALYLGRDELHDLLDSHEAHRFTPFSAPVDEERVLDGGGRSGIDFADVRTDPNANLFDAVREKLQVRARGGERILIGAYSDGARERLGHLLEEHGLPDLITVESWVDFLALKPGQIALGRLPVEKGFAVEGGLIVTEQDILGERLARARAQKRRAENFLTEVSTLSERDLVVHVEHGIGRYEGLTALDVGGAPHDCLKVVYHGGDKLYVPVENIEVLSRFGDEDAAGELDRLGGANWQARKAKIKQRLKDMAAELIKIAAAREMQNAEKIMPPEGLYEEFAARFPYPETDDQLRAIEDTLEDLSSGRSMDRLVCGDVGFGKTEIALRAAFVAAMAGHQVAVVVPTTLLARQHFRTFKERFQGLPVEVRQLSRLVGARDQALTREGLSDGTVDILVGTHAVLSKQVKFRDLGLLIVDEEQHFGVKQKERLKALREEVHVLTLTATPIPRTLQMAMSGVKEMSLIATPPVDRLAVRTFVLPYDPVIVREAILREHFRGGQSFYVCPRVQDLADVSERLSKLVPEVKVGLAHGQLSPTELESVMTAFYDRQFDVLLSTNIVESGLDIPTANTLIIHRADMFGLSQLYQLRGRIGRSKLRGYAYFTLPQGRMMTAAAEKRLHVMQTLDGLGAGFQLASHDLDIRGAGNLLGEEQSGHIREVGIELYQQMLEEAVAMARGGSKAEDEGGAFTPQISLGTSVLIPENYVRDLNIRLGLYRRLSTLVDRQEIEAFAAELIDRFGPIPEEVENLLEVMTIKRLCRDAGVVKLDAGPKGAVVAFHNDNFANPSALVGFIQSQAGKVQVRPDQKLVYRRTWERPVERTRGARQLLTKLADLATAT